jgi:hypothetical protein
MSASVILVPLAAILGLIFLVVSFLLPFYVRGIYLEIKKSNEAVRALDNGIQDASTQARAASNATQDVATLNRQLLRAYGHEPEV